MKLPITLLIICLKTLILIGDITILISKSLIKIPTYVLKYLKFNFGQLKANWAFAKQKVARIFTKKVKKRKRSRPTKIFPLPIGLKIKYFLIGSLFSFIFLFLPLLISLFLQDLPSPEQLSFQPAPLTTKIYDRNKILLYQIYANQNRTLVPLSDIPEYLKKATIAIEDKNFYSNSGFDLGAIIRSAIADISGQPLQGGSTITQQLIKSTLLSPEISLRRKIKEIVLAVWAERIYTKDKILEMYFNQVPYGGTAWGIEAAAEVYFGKNVKNLDLAQSAFLAGLPKAPSLYSPYGESPNLWQQRQKEVLQRMFNLNYIEKQEFTNALYEQLSFQLRQMPIHAPHFVWYVKDLLIKKYGIGMVEKGGLNVITSLNLKTENLAEQIVAEEVDKDLVYNLTNAAALVTNPANGEILAMVGSKDYTSPNGGNFNVTTALRQAGSAIKVITYAAALANGITAATFIDDSPVTYDAPSSPPYSPVNYDGKFHGFITMRNALANSINVAAVKTLNKIGIPTMVSLAKKMGITTWGEPNQYGLSITLGAAEVKMTDLATVYGVLANNGERVNLNPILKITDSQGNVLEEKKHIPAQKVIDTGIAFILTNILQDNHARALEFGTNSPLDIKNHAVAVKTGTSNNLRDNWTIGYTPAVLAAVWVGNNDNSPMSGIASGITGAAPIWNKIMTNLLENTQEKSVTLPYDVVKKQCLGRSEYFIKSTENTTNCTFIPTPTPTPSPNL